MNIKFILPVIFVALVVNVRSQTAFHKGSANATLGFGFPSLFEEFLIDEQMSFGYSAAGYSSREEYSYDSKHVNPIYAKCEYGLKKHTGIGLVIGYSALNIKETKVYSNSSPSTPLKQYTDITQLNIKTISFGFRYNIHFFKWRVLDPYVGFAGGYMLVLREFTFQSDNPTAKAENSSFGNQLIPPVYLAVSAGLKYYFKPQWGAYVEFGFDNWALAQIGLVLKLD